MLHESGIGCSLVGYLSLHLLRYVNVLYLEQVMSDLVQLRCKTLCVI